MKKFFWWSAVALWMLVIFLFSSEPDLKSPLEPWYDFIFRKIAHISEFFVLSYLVFRALKGHTLGFSFMLFLTVTVTVGYAFFDEYHQLFVWGRHGSILDVGIDSIGVVIFFLLLRLYKEFYKNLGNVYENRGDK